MMKRLLAALLAALCLSALPLTVLGANATEVTVVLPYYHVWKTDVPNADDRFTYRWTAETQGAPMPSGKTGKYWDWHLRGNTEGKLALTYTFTGPGTYSYRLAAYVPQPKKGYSYEPRTFLLTIAVLNAPGGGLRAEWVLLNERSGKKVDQIDLDPSYVTGRKSGDDHEGHKKKRKKATAGTSSTSGKRTAQSVKTGDETRIQSMIVVLSVSGVLMLYLLYEELHERRGSKK